MTSKIAILYPMFFGGGAESVTAWMLQALKDHHEISLFTFSPIDFQQLDRQFGTELNKAKISVHIPLLGLWGSQYARGYSLLTLRQHLLAHEFRKVHSQYDLAISAFNEMDLGRVGIQYVHVPLFGHGTERARRVLGYPSSPARSAYRTLCERLTGYSDERMRSNLTLTNSHWTANLIELAYNLRAEVVYPPVTLNDITVPWTTRENGFICSGRISPDKNLELVIEIIYRVRKRGFDVHLHILSGGYDSTYRSKISKMCAENASWLFMQENLSRLQLAQMLAQHRYGIHGRTNETFGISIAEMVRAGCIPFIPSKGGQIEIVGEIPDLQFYDTAEAVDKICQMLANPVQQGRLLNQLALRKDLFNSDEFCHRLRQHVTRMLEQA